MMEQNEKQIAHLFQIHKTLTKMLSDRGYLVSATEQTMDIDQFREIYGSRPSIREAMFSLHTSKDDPTDQIFIFFAETKENQKSGLCVKDIKAVHQRMTDKKVNRSIIIYKEKVSSQAKQALHMMKGVVIEFFREMELLVNITQHKLVPQHLVLTEDQKKSLLARYRLNETQLPRIQKDDPVARYYGLKRLQVVKIIRDSETAGRYVTYRIVW